MEKENFTFNISGEQAKPIEVIIKHGTTDPTIYPVKLVAKGTLPAVAEYINKSWSHIEGLSSDQGLIEYSLNPNELYIKFSENPKDKDAAVITGTMEKNPDITAFCINKDARWTNDQLQKLIKGYAHCFDLQEARTFLENLRNFDVVFTEQHTKLDDRRGNAEEAVKHSIKYAKGEIPLILSLNMPLFIGTGKANIPLEIEIDKDGSKPVFSFFSLEYESKIREAAEIIMAGELQKLSDFPQIQVK